MPFFATNPLEEIALKPGECDATILLSGLDECEAIARLENLLQSPRTTGAYRFEVCFDPPAGDGEETLFLPIGRFLLDARRRGRISRCLPLPEGTGYYFELAIRATS